MERIGDHAEDFHEIGMEMTRNKLTFSEQGRKDIASMRGMVMQMFDLARDAFENLYKDKLPELDALEENVDKAKKDLFAAHFARLAEGKCTVEVSPYFSSVITRLERVADHLVNVGYSIVNPTGSQKEYN